MSEQYGGGPASSGQPPTPPPPPGQAPPPPPPGQPGQPPYGAAPYGQQPPPGQAPYGQQPYAQGAYGQQPPHAPQAPYGQPSMGGAQVGQPADLMTRFLARLIDFVILGIVVSVINGIILSIAFSSAVAGGGFGLFTSGWPGTVMALLSAGLSLGYFALMESSRGQTLGKMIMKIRTFGPGGGSPTMNEALKRNVWTAASVLGVIPFVGFIGSLLYLAAAIAIAVTINNNTATRQGWHDTFAGGTTVIKVG